MAESVSSIPDLQNRLKDGGGAPAPSTKQAPTVQPLRVLLAEDNAVNQKLELRLLERMGLTADVANDGKQAIAAVEKQRYDVVLMDV